MPNNPHPPAPRVRERLAPGVRLTVDYFVARRSYDPYETVVTSKIERKEVSRHVVALPEVQKIPGTGGDALRAVQNMPGVARAPFGAGLIVVRGASPEATRIFLEGHEIPQLFHFGGLTSVFNSDILKQIVFIPGNFGVDVDYWNYDYKDILTRQSFQELINEDCAVAGCGALPDQVIRGDTGFLQRVNVLTVNAQKLEASGVEDWDTAQVIGIAQGEVYNEDEVAERVSTPTELLWATRGDFPRESYESIAARMGNARIRDVEAGHLVPMERPELVVDAVLATAAQRSIG
mgnify:CR=1 FL=1